MRQRYTVSISLDAPADIATTTITAALALAMESEAIKEIGGVNVTSIEVYAEEVDE